MPISVLATQGSGYGIVDQLQQSKARLASPSIVSLDGPVHAKTVAQKLTIIVPILEHPHECPAFGRDIRSLLIVETHHLTLDFIRKQPSVSEEIVCQTL